MGLTARVLLDAFEHPRQLWGISAVGIEMLGYDDLVTDIDRDLGIVALDEAVGGLQDPGVRIGEVALSRVLQGTVNVRWGRRGSSSPRSPGAVRASASRASRALWIFVRRIYFFTTQSGSSSPV